MENMTHNVLLKELTLAKALADYCQYLNSYPGSVLSSECLTSLKEASYFSKT